MKAINIKTFFLTSSLAVCCVAQGLAVQPLGSGFTYQGRLNDGGAPANGLYDLGFVLHDDPASGSYLGSSIIVYGVPVTNGLFTVQLNTAGEFGANAFNGSARWLEIDVRTNGGGFGNNFTVLSPRQVLTPAPQALFALNASNASNALNAAYAASVADGSISSSKLAPGTLAWTNVSGVNAGPGLSLGANNTLSASFAGTGSANNIARSDHNHFGASWAGNASFGLGLSVSNTAANGAGLFGQQGTGSGFPYVFGNTAGVWGESSQGSGVFGASGYASGSGVYGLAAATSGQNFGVQGVTYSSVGIGVAGTANAAAGGIGVSGTSKSGSGQGVCGISTATNGTPSGVYGESHAPNGKAVYGYSVTSSGTSYGVFGLNYSSNGFGIYGRSGAAATNTSRPIPTGTAVFGESQNLTAVAGVSDLGDGVSGSSSYGSGLSGYSYDGYGVQAESDGICAVYADTTGVASVIAFATGGDGVWAATDTGYGLKGSSTSGVGVYAYSSSNSPIEAWSTLNNSDTRVFRVSPGGEVYARGSFHPNGADFAEMLPATTALEPGDVLVVGEDGRLTRSTRPNQENVVGVHATQPGFVGGAEEGADLTGKVPLAVVGVVPVKVTAENGPIRPGDKLTTSSTPGRAMKAGNAAQVGTVIGKALNGLKGDQGVIRMLVVLQ